MSTAGRRGSQNPKEKIWMTTSRGTFLGRGALLPHPEHFDPLFYSAGTAEPERISGVAPEAWAWGATAGSSLQAVKEEQNVSAKTILGTSLLQGERKTGQALDLTWVCLFCKSQPVSAGIRCRSLQ